MLRALMANRSNLADQLAILGVHLPSWPKETEETDAHDDWIPLGQAYAEGVGLWRAQLRNETESTKAIVDQLLCHQNEIDELSPWDKWLSSAIRQDVTKIATLDRWDKCIALMKDAPLTQAQILGGLLSMADAQQLSGAVTGALRLTREMTISTECAFRVCTLLISRSDTTWRQSEAKACPKAHQTSNLLHLELCRILSKAASLRDADNEAKRSTLRGSAIASLDRLLQILGSDDRWSGIPRAHALLIHNQSGPEAALEFLESNISWSIPQKTKESHARMFMAEMLAENGNWEEAQDIHHRSLTELEEYRLSEEVRSDRLEIVHAETELLTHELSIALKNRSLDIKAFPEPKLSGKDWTSLSRSQLGQDLWVLERLGWKKNGFFVEFGASDGVLLSNTWLLEKHFQWTGVCAEPNPTLFSRLTKNRSCTLSSACVYSTSGKRMPFVLADAYGGLVDLGHRDQHSAKREAYAASGHVIELTTTSLMDLLVQNKAPKTIDYLSIDTEGSELEILKGINWNQFRFQCITIEHNFTKQRGEIEAILKAQGYNKLNAQWDDWYWKNI